MNIEKNRAICSYCKEEKEIQHVILSNEAKVLRQICNDCAVIIYDRLYEEFSKNKLDDYYERKEQ